MAVGDGAQGGRSGTGQARMTNPAEPGVREGYIPVPGADLYFRAVGKGPTLVILHGGPDFNHNYLLPELDRLSSAFRLIYYDQRGRGRSSRNVAPNGVNLESEIDDLERVRRYFGLDTMAVLGHSWGCLLAMEYATRHSERVSHLVLLNAAPASHVDFQHFRQQRLAAEGPTLAKMHAIASKPDYAAGDVETDAEYYRAHFSKALNRSDQLQSVVRRLRSHFTPSDIIKAREIEDSLYAETWLSPEYDVLARLRSAKILALIIHGENDLIPLQCATHVAEALAGSRLVVQSGCGHFAYPERPGKVLDAIADFVPQR
jgi:proline iminopeptidase